jgi:hypothetical protein
MHAPDLMLIQLDSIRVARVIDEAVQNLFQIAYHCCFSPRRSVCCLTV